MFQLRLTLACLLAATATAAAVQPLPSLPELAARSAKRHPQPVRVGDLVGRTVLRHLESQPQLGHVREVARRADGSADVIVAYGGLFALHPRPIRVPVEAMSVLGEYMEILEFTPEQLDTFPTVGAPGDETLPHDAVIPVALGHPAH